MIKQNFIPIDYDYFDWKGRNYARIIGRNSEGKRICIIDSCSVYFWTILKSKTSKKKINSIIKKIQKIKLDTKGRKTKVEKVELQKKNFMDKPVQALKVYATNYKDLHDIANQIDFPEIEKRRGYDLGFVTHYIIEKQLKPLQWYQIQGELLNNSEDFGEIDMALDVDYCIKLDSHKDLEARDNKSKVGKRSNLITPEGGSEPLGEHLGGISERSRQQPTTFTPKVLAFDIETDELKIGEGEILMISLASNDGFKKVITWKGKDIKTPNVEHVEDETKLLERFVEHVRKISPDFLVGYYSDGFDMPYLKARAEEHKVKLSLGLDDSQPRFSRGVELTAKTKGIVHLDLLKFIRTAYAQYMQSETLSLNEVAKEFLGDTKKQFDPIETPHKENWKEFFEYNLHDSILTLGLFGKFWPDLLEFSRVMQEPLEDVSRNGLSKQVENYILHNLDKFNEIPEKRPTYDEIGERRHRRSVEGAFVLEPTPGLYENIGMFDFSSMHTSIIISMNISKATLLDRKPSISKTGYYESPELELNNKKQKFYFQKKQGFFPTLFKEILEKRKYYKEQYKKNPNLITKARSNAFKLLSASVHGYIGFFGARYYSLESSASILAFVRKFNQDTIEKIRKAGFKVIYGDTDSTSFELGKKSQKQTLEYLDKLNKQLPGVMELELDGFYKRGLWVSKRSGGAGAKKKYALIDKKGNLKIRGFETVRRDWCHLAREVQNKVIRQVLKDGNEKKALEYLKEIIHQIKDRKINLQDLIITTQLKKPLEEYKAISPHVIAAQKMAEQEIPITQGNLVAYFIAETKEKKKLVRDKVKLPHEPGKYNIEYYLEKQILPAVENIFQVFEIDVKDLIKDKTQTTLDSF